MKKIYFLLTLMSFAAITNAQVSGIKTIGVDYPTLSAAIADLNLVGVGAGGATINVPAAFTEIAPVGGYNLGSAVLNTSLSVTNPLVIKKSGVGTNPLLSAYVGTVTLTTTSAVVDGIFSFNGCDYVTVDAIDIIDNNASGASMMEYGYGFFKASATDGSQHNTIKNCVISMNKDNNVDGTTSTFGAGSKGIYFGNVTRTNIVTDLVIASAAGQNNSNIVVSNTIQNCFMGIYMRGYGDGTAPFSNIDQNNSIGGNSPSLGNIIRNFGTGIQTAFGISTFNQNGLLIQYNNVNNLAGGGSTHGGTILGISASGSFTLNNSTYDIRNNTVTIGQGTNTGQSQGINIGTAGGTGTVNISQNLITGFTNTSGATAGTVFGTVVSNTAGATLNITNNTYSNNQISNVTNMLSIQASAAAANVNITGNNFTNNTVSNIATGATFMIASSAPVTSSYNINNNNIDGLTYSVANSQACVMIQTTSLASTCALSISNNDIRNIVFSALSSSAVTMLTNSGASISQNISNNTFTNLNLNTTGNTTFISNNLSLPANGVKTVNNNSIVTGFTKVGAGGTVTLFTDSGSDPATATNNVTNNNFSNINVTGATTINGIVNTNGGSPIKNVTGNTVSNITGGTSAITGMSISFDAGTTTVTSNTISNITSGGSITGILFGTSGTNGTTNASRNTVHSLIGGGTGVVTGISSGGASTTQRNLFKNKIYNLENTSTTTGTVNGVLLGSGNQNVNNNLIGDLRAPAANSTTDAVRGISITSSTTLSNIDLSYNTVYLNAASSGTNFSTSALFHTFNTTGTTSNLTLRNNIFVNTSTPNGSGLVSAFRRSASTNLNNFSTASDRNLFYTGTPSANRLIYYDGTNADQTLAAYQARVAPRDANSITENPPFLSTSGSAANFLHINPSAVTALQGGALPVAGINDDFDGDVRNASTPDIGADEFTLCVTANGGTASGSQSFCGSGTPAITAAGYSTGAGSMYQWVSSNNIADYPASGTAVAGQTNPASLTTGVVSATTYYWLRVSCSTGPSTANSNLITITVNPSVANISASTTVICAGQSATLTENGGTGTGWLWSPGGATNQSISVSPTTTTNYTVTVTSPGGCTAMANVTIVVNPVPTGVTASASSNSICVGAAPINLFSTANSASPNILSQDFEAGLGAWTTTNNTTGGTPANTAWTTRSHGYVSPNITPVTFNSPGGTEFILSNADLGGSGTNVNTLLESPVFSTVGYSAVNLSLRQYYRLLTSGEANVEVSTNGSTWSTVKSYIATQGTATAFASDNIDLSAFLNQATVSIRFRFQNGWSWYWAIDDIAVTGTPVANTFAWTSSPAGYTSNLQNPTGISPAVTTTYTVEVSGVGGCKTSASTTVTVSDNSATIAYTPSTACTSAAPVSVTRTGAAGGTYSALPAGLTINSSTGEITPGTSTANTYTITYTNAAVGACLEFTTTASFTVNAAPTAYAVTGGGAYCASGTGVPVGLSNSQTGVNYQLVRDAISNVGTPLAGNGAAISFGNQLTAGTYTVVATNGTTMCSSNMTGSVVISINPVPVIGSTLGEPTTCASSDGSITLTLSGAAGPYTFVWTGSGVNTNSQNQTGLTVGAYGVTVTAANGCSATASFGLNGPGGCSICPTVGSITTTPSGSSCSGSPITFTASGLVNMGSTYGITFKQSTVALANPYVGGTTIATVTNGGLSSGGTVATATATLPVGNYFLYAILSPTPVDPLCRPFVTVNHNVSQTPDVNQPTNQVVCNNAATTAVNFTGAVPGTVYNWTNNSPSIGLAATGVGDIASFTAINATSAPVVATVTVTPTATTGGGGGAVTQTFNYTGSIENWVVPAGVTSIRIEAKGAEGSNSTTSSVGPGKGAVMAGDFAVTPGSSLKILVGEQVTNTGGNGGGGGTFVTSNTNSPLIVAGGGAGSSDGDNSNKHGQSLTSGGNGPAGGGTGGIAGNGGNIGVGFFQSGAGGGLLTDGADGWIAGSGGFAFVNGGAGGSAIQSGGFGGGASGSGWIVGGAGGGYSGGGSGSNVGSTAMGGGGGSINNGTNQSNTAGAQTGNGQVIITYGGTTTTTCTGTPKTFTITVNPTATVTAVTNQVVCNGANTTAVNFTSPTTGGTIVYNWTNNTTSIGLAASGTGNIASFVGTNATSAPVTATIMVTPTYTNGSVSCVGTASTFTITVNPTATVTAVTNQVVCNGAPTTAVAFSSPTTGGTIVYNWTNNTTSIGLAGSGTGNIASFVGTNATSAPVTATITVTPTYTNGSVSCVGTASSFTITVNPTATVNTVSNQVVCNGAPTTAVAFSSPTTGGTIVYNWTNNTTSIGLAGSGTGNIASFVGTNATTAPVTATITVTPTYTNGSVSCVGTASSFTITVNPTATVNTVTNQVVCNGAPTTAVAFSSPTTGGTIVYNWTNNTTSIGLAGTGTGNIASFAAVNTTTAPVTATITVTPTYTNGGVSCVGTARTFTITVNPTPTVTQPTSQTVCTGAMTAAVTFTGAVTGTTYQWTNNNTATGLAASGTGNIAAFTALNTTTGALVSTITVTPVFTNGGVSCSGTPATFTITVNPVVNITCPANMVFTSPVGSCSAVATYSPTVVGIPTPAITYSFSGATTGSGAGSGSGASFNVGVTTVTLTATNSCGTKSCSFTVTVNDGQLPVITTQPVTRSACESGNTTLSVTATNAVSYQWEFYNGTTWVSVAGATASTYTVTNLVRNSNTNTYRVRVIGRCTTITSTTATIFVLAKPEVSIVSNQTLLIPGSNFVLTAVTDRPAGTGSYVWFKNGVIIPGATSASLPAGNINDRGTYKVTYTDANGCVNTSADFEIGSIPTTEIFVYPNPSNGQFQIRYYNAINERPVIYVYNASGQVVYQNKMPASTQIYARLDVNISNLAAGTYVIKVIGVGGKVLGSKQIVKSN